VKKQRNEMMVGLFVLVGFTILSLMVFFVSGVHFFRSGYALSVMYDYVDILDKGAPVRMAGVRVGEVSLVELIPGDSKEYTRVKVKLFINEGVEIREHYAFEIRGTHILSEPHIQITPLPGEGGLVKDGDLLEGAKLVPLEDLIKRAHNIAASLDEMIGGVNTAMKEEGTSQSMRDLIVNLSKMSASLEKIFSGSEDDMKKTITQLRSSTDSLAAVMEKIEKGEGTAGSLIVKDEIYNDLRDFVKDIKAHPWKLLKKDGGKKFLFF
jgi:phospholipid/cholesterol/gamma-HCH transport system substrate-binding protein